MDLLLIALATGGLLSAMGLAIALGRSRKSALDASTSLAACQEKLAQLEARFRTVTDAEAEAARIRSVADAEKVEAAREVARLRSEADTLRQQYSLAFQRHQQLETEVRSLEEDLENVSVGLYKPHFTYADSDAYKAAITKTRDQQKSMIRSGQATHCGTEWTVGGSKRDGERMIKQYERLVLRAFNAESDASIANVTWNNYQVMKTRIEKTFDALNKLGTVMNVSLTPEYRNARLNELQLVFEAVEKKRLEREEQRRLRAEQREEERVQRELQKEQEEAEHDEARFEKALEKARAELAASIDAEREAMLTRVQALEADLAAAHSRKERAIAQAELTKVGHVYVISNIGAFGEGILKIGLTRRLDPEERVKELGDTSVPFPFDLHGLIYSENAPNLETQLHNRFWERRVNWANDRKEFFKVSLDEVSEVFKELGLEASLRGIPEAREYRETLVAVSSSRSGLGQEASLATTGSLPEDPFASGSPVSSTNYQRT